MKQIGDTQSQMASVLTRVVVLEERATTVRDRLATLESAVNDNAKGVAAVSPWLSVARMLGSAVIAALGTSIAAYVAIRFGLPKG